MHTLRTSRVKSHNSCQQEYLDQFPIFTLLLNMFVHFCDALQNILKSVSPVLLTSSFLRHQKLIHKLQITFANSFQLSSHICLADSHMLVYPMFFNIRQTTAPHLFQNLSEIISFSQAPHAFPLQTPKNRFRTFSFQEIKPVFVKHIPLLSFLEVLELDLVHCEEGGIHLFFGHPK